MQTYLQYFATPESLWVLAAAASFFAVCKIIWHVAAWKTRVDGGLVDLQALTTKVDKIYQAIMFSNLEHGVQKADSPITLSDYGKELDAKIIADRVVSIYSERMHIETQDMNAYQIQEHCFAFCDADMLLDLEREHNDIFQKMSAVAFEEGQPLEKLMRVVGIKLRDRVLAMQEQEQRVAEAGGRYRPE